MNLKSVGWTLKEAFLHTASVTPGTFALTAKLFFSPVVGLIKGRPLAYMAEVDKECDEWTLNGLKSLNERLDKNPYDQRRPE